MKIIYENNYAAPSGRKLFLYYIHTQGVAIGLGYIALSALFIIPDHLIIQCFLRKNKIAPQTFS
ncbi:MAG: hypothetical protein LBU83_01790 [Bacteroidales bacterium]|jgi:hypothetical protein|nr:hypothetical protein [Bacteroidales bacterium]